MVRMNSRTRRLALMSSAFAVLSYLPAAHADTSYFSFQGTFSVTSGATQDFFYTLPSVGGNNPVTLKTMAYSGGTNAAGQSIASGGIDSVLTLFNSVPTQIAANDDASPGVPAGTRDSLLSPTGTGTSLLANQTAGSYDLRLSNFSSTIGDGHWATDIVNAATGVNTTLTASTGSNSSISSLAFGATGSATATVSLTSGSLTVGGTLTQNAGGVLNLAGGTLNANGNINVANQFTYSSGTFNWAAGKTMTISGSNAHVDIINSFGYVLPASAVVNVNNAGSRLKVTSASANATLYVNSGSQVNVTGGALLPDFLFIGTNGSGAISLSGAALTAAGTSSGYINTIGGSSPGTLTLSSASTATFANPLFVGDFGSTVTVQSGSALNTGNVSVGADTIATAAASTITITGGSSSMSQSGASTLTVGAAAGSGTGIINVINGASLSTGTGLTTINKTGSIKVGTGGSAGILTCFGSLTVNGGSFTVDPSASFSISDNNTVLLQNGATAAINSGLLLPGSNITVDASSLTLATSQLGLNGKTANLTFQNGATGTLTGTFGLAQSIVSGSTSNITVQSGAQVSAGAGGATLIIAPGGFAGQTASLTVTGAGSSFNQGAATPATIALGTTSNSPGSINVLNGASFTSGTGQTTINPTGSINVGGGTYTANGPIYSNGAITVYGGSFNSASTISTYGPISVTSGTFSTNYLTLASGQFSASASNVSVGNSGIYMGSYGYAPTATFDGGTFTSTGNIDNLTGTITFQNGAVATVASLSNGDGGIDNTEVATVNVTGNNTSIHVTGNVSLTSYIGVGVLNVSNGGAFLQGTPTINTCVPAQIGSGGLSTYSAPSTAAVLNITNGGRVAMGTLPAYATINFASGSLGFVGDLPVGFGANAPLGSSITLNSDRSLALSGTTTIDPGASLTLSGGSLSTGTLVNNGTFNFNSGTLAFNGASGLTVGSGGPLGPSVNLSAGKSLCVATIATVASSGVLYLNGGSFSALSGVTNNGEIQFLDTTSQFTGGTLTNNKLIDGNGRVSNNLTNSSTGELRATGTTQRLTFAGSANTNSGKINMVNGGTIEFTGPLTNNASGVITGRGALFTSSLTNNGQIQISAGLTDVYGPVTTNSGGKIIVSGTGTATFYNPVTMNAGSEFRVSTGSTAVFFAPVTGVGTFTGTGAKFFEAGASAPGSLDTGGSTFVVAPASLNVDYLREASLTVSGTATTNPNSPTSTLNSLSIDPGASLDLANNKLVLDYTGPSPIDQVRQYLLSTRLISSTAAADPLHREAIAYAESSILGVNTWGGVAVDSTSVLTKLTYLGDANMDGSITPDDYALLDRGLALHLTGWTSGDFNYDGVINSADYLLIDRVYLQQGAPLSPAFLAQRESQFGADYVQQLLTSIPEPSSLLTACGLALPLLPRRRTR